jgi:2-polyprenyl-3-methyl-5-hydroxy-6-metoxy-1,4-benzoquinol methylase
LIDLIKERYNPATNLFRILMLREDPQLQSVIDTLLHDKNQLKVLEIGCGSCSHVDLGQNAYMVGIDISQKQLDRNTTLDEKICGDVESYFLPQEEFDVIVCWWILEHLSHPDKALENCQKSLKKDGIMILAIPNVMSVKGLITKLTPHWFHVWFYRYIFGEKLAGIDDQVPFKTYLRMSLSPPSIKQFAKERTA